MLDTSQGHKLRTAIRTSFCNVQVLASAPSTNGQGTHAADTAPAGRTTASVSKPQQQGDDGEEDPVQQVMDADEQELLESELDAADATNSSVAAGSAPVGDAAPAPQPGSQAANDSTSGNQAADRAGEKRQGSGSAADTAAAPAARLPKVKSGQLDAGGAAAAGRHGITAAARGPACTACCRIWESPKG